MNDPNFAPLVLGVLSIIVSISAFVLGDSEKNKTWRIGLGISFLFLAIILGTYGVVVLMLPSDEGRANEQANSSTSQTVGAGLPTSTHTSTPTETATTIPHTPTPTPPVEENTPAQNSKNETEVTTLCSELGSSWTSPPIWQPTESFATRLFSHCPPSGEIEYRSIAVDDVLTKVEKACDSTHEDVSDKFRSFSLPDEELIHYQSDPISVESGCIIVFTVRDVKGERIGLFIKDAGPPIGSIAEIESFCAFLTVAQIQQLQAIQDVQSAISEAERMAGYRQNDFQKGATIPADVVIATDLLTPDIAQYGVRAVNNAVGWGLFLTTREFVAPNDGTYWCVK